MIESAVPSAGHLRIEDCPVPFSESRESFFCLLDDDSNDGVFSKAIGGTVGAAKEGSQPPAADNQATHTSTSGKAGLCCTDAPGTAV